MTWCMVGSGSVSVVLILFGFMQEESRSRSVSPRGSVKSNSNSPGRSKDGSHRSRSRSKSRSRSRSKSRSRWGSFFTPNEKCMQDVKDTQLRFIRFIQFTFNLNCKLFFFFFPILLFTSLSQTGLVLIGALVAITPVPVLEGATHAVGHTAASTVAAAATRLCPIAGGTSATGYKAHWALRLHETQIIPHVLSSLTLAP